jgi:hypothetical protein
MTQDRATQMPSPAPPPPAEDCAAKAKMVSYTSFARAKPSQSDQRAELALFRVLSNAPRGLDNAAASFLGIGFFVRSV